MKKQTNVFLSAVVAALFLTMSSFVPKANPASDCAQEAADFVQMAVSDGQSWEYASAVGNLVYEQCLDREDQEAPN